MAWTAGIPGAGEARLYALEDIIKANVSLLNDAVRLNSAISYLITKTPQLGPLDPERCVDIGDLEVMPDLKNGWCQIRIEGGGWREGLDVTSVRRHISGATADTFISSVCLYLHGEAFRNEQKQMLGRQRCIAQEVCSDWLRARVLNFVNQPTYDYRQLTLQSQERNTAGGPVFDTLSECIAISGSRGTFRRQFGTEVVYGVEFTHSGALYD